MVKKWLEPTSVRDIQVFIGFANFYRCFIRDFSRIAVSLTSMLKTTKSFDDLAPKAFKANGNKVVGSGGRVDETIVNSSKSKKSKNKKSGNLTYIGATGEPNFLTPGTKEAFNRLRQVFIKVLILQHFGPECHIRIETDVSSYAIGGVLSQLSSDWVDRDGSILFKSDISQWYLVAYFSRKMILAETRYKTHNAELLAIIEAFKT